VQALEGVFTKPMRDHGRARRIALLAAAIIVFAAAGPAQEHGSGAVQERVSATIIEVPVNVLGKDGKGLAGLTVADFELYDNGKRQEISGFQVVDLSRTVPTTAPANPFPEAPPPVARRHWLLAFDLTYTSLTSLLRARGGAYSFVQNDLGPYDLVGVATLTIDHGWKLLENFTTDRVQLAHAIDTLGIVKHGIQLRDPLGFAFTPPGEEVAVSDDDFQDLLRKANDQYERGRIAQHVQNLGDMAQILDSVRGRKHVLLFSEGFDSRLLMGNAGKFQTPMGQRDSTQDTAPENVVHGQIWKVDNDTRYGSSATRQFLESAMSVFRRSDVILDTIDISGLRAGGDVTRRSASGADVLFTMANETNGDFIRNANEFSTELKALVARTDLVYLLAFQPKNLSKPGTFHELRVKVRVPTSRVVSRSGYVEPRPYRDLTPMERVLASGDLLTSGGGQAQLPVHVLAAPFACDRGLSQVPVVIEIEGKPLLDGETADARELQIYVYASDANGTLTDYVTQNVSLDVRQLREKLDSGGVKFYGTLFLPPGRYTLRTLVRSVASNRVSVTTSTISVPGVPGIAAVLQPIFFDPTPATSWIMVKADRARAVSSAPPEYPFAVGGTSYLPAAGPVIARGAASQVAVVTFNFGDREQPEPLELSANVMGPDGAPRDVDVHVLRRSDREHDGARSLVLYFNALRLEPGRYVLRVEVKSSASQQSERSEAAFEVR